jgi:Na+/proline symporter/signal transduction histidine kinase
MVDATLIVLFAIAYIGLLFAIAWAGDVFMKNRANPQNGRPFIYAMSIGVYCSTWTFFGSVGRASSTGWDFLAVYIGPALVFIFGWPLLLRIVRLAKAQNITSIADFLAARYGKSPIVAGIVTIVALIGLLPYLALQLKAVVLATEALFGGNPLLNVDLPSLGIVETAFVATVAMAAFAVLFGTRHIDATEHQDGLMVAIATESIVKLVAFLGVGIFVVFYAFGDAASFYRAVLAHQEIVERFSRSAQSSTWLIVTILSAICIVILPRQFHVTVVENRSEHELMRARWLLPLYLLLINLFVVPIAAAGLILIRPELASPDVFVLSVPMHLDAYFITVLAYIGGLSAAMAMIVVESIALAIMVCNGVVVPLLLRYRVRQSDDFQNISHLLLTIRRIAICVLLLLCYVVYLLLGDAKGLAAIGLISFAAVAQLAPAFFGGLYWKQGNAHGAIAGVLCGITLWAYTLLLPWVINAGLLPETILTEGPLGLSFLNPQALLYFEADPLTHGVMWSLAANIAAYVFVSRQRSPSPIERLQAHIFVEGQTAVSSPQPSFRFWRTSVTVGDLQTTVGRYLGPGRTDRSFSEFQASRNLSHRADSEADVQTLRFSEHLLTSAIGAASSRLVMTLLLQRRNVTNQSALKLLDDASEALQYNRDILQSALDQVRHGLCVFNKDNQLVCWNRQFSELLSLPLSLRRVGVPLEQILQFLAERGDMGDGDPAHLVAERMMQLGGIDETFQERLVNGQQILEVRTAAMPQGGIVTTYSDITERVAAADALSQINQTLEQRVKERTAELLEANAALASSKLVADEANRDKTRFLAAASHDILQPLNAARLYATALAERSLPPDEFNIARRIDTSLTSVEEILKTLVDISRIDSGRLEPDIADVAIQELFDALKIEFDPLARENGLDLRFVPSSMWVRTDRQLLRRILRNLIANALKYTNEGRVLVGARRNDATVALEVLDTGIGIPAEKHGLIFQEFHRLDSRATSARGLGLGLSIVERISRMLGHPITVQSEVGRGSRFRIELPRAAAHRAVVTIAEIPSGPRGLLDNAIVICIDNEPEVLEGMRTLLTGWGCVVIAADRPETAVERFDSYVDGLGATTEKVIPAIILADYHLDEGTGIEAVLDIRAHLSADVPGVIITADHSPEVRRRLRELELTLLPKPLKAGALRAVMMQSVRRMAAE